MTDTISFFVEGIPKPAGSKNAFLNKKSGKINVVDACKSSKGWKTTVAKCAKLAAAESGWVITDEPVSLSLSFYMPRPKAHYRKLKESDRVELRKDAPLLPSCKPDLSKLERAVEDALTKIIWKDDAQFVTRGVSYKRYCQETDHLCGVRIEVKIIKEV